MAALVEPGTLVLIVDDDVELHDCLVDALTIEGYEALAVRSGDAALRQLANGVEPSLVILDLWLTDMSGGDFVRWLRASRHAAIPVLLHSGAPSPANIELEVDAIVRKPAEGTALMRAVDRLVARGSTKHLRARRGDPGLD
jgi:DNA-binding response OmpR family regulator